VEKIDVQEKAFKISKGKVLLQGQTEGINLAKGEHRKKELRERTPAKANAFASNLKGGKDTGGEGKGGLQKKRNGAS